MAKANTVRKASKEKASFRLPKKQWKEFCDAFDAPSKTIPALRKLLNNPGLFDATTDNINPPVLLTKNLHKA